MQDNNKTSLVAYRQSFQSRWRIRRVIPAGNASHAVANASSVDATLPEAEESRWEHRFSMRSIAEGALMIRADAS
jgi:hypothetical protein